MIRVRELTGTKSDQISEYRKVPQQIFAAYLTEGKFPVSQTNIASALTFTNKHVVYEKEVTEKKRSPERHDT